MTDRYNTITVTLEQPTRDDDAEDICRAIRAMRGVGGAVLGEVDETFGVRQQERHRFLRLLNDLADEVVK